LHERKTENGFSLSSLKLSRRPTRVSPFCVAAMVWGLPLKDLPFGIVRSRSTDLAGAQRVRGRSVDMGAFENQGRSGLIIYIK